MSNEKDSISEAGAGQANAAGQENFAERVRKLREDVKDLSETLERVRESAAQAADPSSARRADGS